MLILKRKLHERIVLILTDGTEMFVEFVERLGGSVRIGVEAPREIQVHRAEIWDKIKAKEQHANDQQTESTAVGVGPAPDS
jgi:carbon storage regulator